MVKSLLVETFWASVGLVTVTAVLAELPDEDEDEGEEDGAGAAVAAAALETLTETDLYHQPLPSACR
jgi:hypothetical protein